MKNPRLYRRRKLALILYIKDVYARARLKANPELWNYLEPVIEKSISTGCDFYELWTLYRYILKARPKFILELGSGISTVVITYAIKGLQNEGYAPKFVSMEESDVYYGQLKSIIPADLQPMVELIHSPAVDRELENGLIARCYADKPRHAYDFVFIDGPQYPPKTPNIFDGDLLDVIAWNDQPFVAFLDERIVTRNHLKALLPFVKSRETKGFTKFYVPEASRRKLTYRFKQ